MIDLLKDQLIEYTDKIKILEAKMVEKVKKTGSLEDIEALRPELDEINGLKMMRIEVVKMMDRYLK